MLEGEKMLNRKIMEELISWKNMHRKECLLVKGARQIGKTFIIEKFGKTHYTSYIYINFIKEPEQKKIFDGSLSADEIYKRISLYVDNVTFIEHDTLIFLDEIQDCPNARTALKFLALDGRYDVIASGSLLGLNYKEISSVPVGYERQIEMSSLDFEEFLWAIGKSKQSIATLKYYFDHKEKVDDGINQEYLSILNDYMVVGGMPEAVNVFIETNNYQEVYKIQQKILNSYFYDINNYSTVPEKPKIAACYRSIPRQLAKDHTRFQYKTIEEKATSRKFASSLDWLLGASLIKACCNVATPMFPLIAYEKPEQFKIYMHDIGLLTSMFGQETQQAILKGNLVGPAKGGIYENLIFDILAKRGYSLYYFKTENSTQEIEFLITKEQSIIPIEVKAKNGTTLSLNNFIDQFKPPFAYKLVTGNVGVVDTKITIPLYMALFI